MTVLGGETGPAVLSLIETLHTNLAGLDPGLEDRLAKEFYHQPTFDISGDPDSYSLDMASNSAASDAEKRAGRYTHPELPTADQPEPCRPCPNAACPYVPDTAVCPLLAATAVTVR